MTKKRINNGLISRFEHKFIQWICARIPTSVTSDHLTLLGFMGSIATALGLAFVSVDSKFSILAVLGLFLNWFGDSLDGSLARFRKSERPGFGYFVDHLTDAFVMMVIAIGGAFTPQISLSAAGAILAAYFLLTILTLINCNVTGVMRITYGGFGPTEMRIALIAVIVSIVMFPEATVTLFDWEHSVFDVLLFAVAGLLVGTAVFYSWHFGKEHYEQSQLLKTQKKEIAKQ